MRIGYMSDIHMEFVGHRGRMFDVQADVLVLAGDIGSSAQAIPYARSLFDGPIVQIAGNHEHYGSRYDKTISKMREDAKEHSVHFLENDSITILGHRFIGATLWTNFNDNPLDMMLAEQGINDFHRTKYRDGDICRKLRAKDILDKNLFSRFFIFDELAEHPNSIVVTHHAPTYASVNEKYRGDPLNSAYANSLQSLGGAPLWFHGHMHDPCDYIFDGTRVLCNPIGYPGQNTSAGIKYVEI